MGMGTFTRLNACMLAVCLCLLGCNSTSEDEDTYEDMTSRYTTYTVEGLWEAMAGGDDVSGTYILLKDEVYDIQGQVATLMDRSTSKVIDCRFEDGLDLSGIAEGDTVTIGGRCYFMESSSYPELDSCDYLYINSQG
jgi:hypothetical protein